MTPRREFHPLQAVEIATAFQKAGVDYLFIGKGGAILLGFPGTTQEVVVFVPRSGENSDRLIAALRELGFEIGERLAQEVCTGKDFVQIKSGPFDVDLVFAPDGIESFAAARARSVTVDAFTVASIRDIIASKRASNRQKDLIDLPLLEAFREEFERLQSKPLRTAAELAAERAERMNPKTP
jgi:hypothetical protein